MFDRSESSASDSYAGMFCVSFGTCCAWSLNSKGLMGFVYCNAGSEKKHEKLSSSVRAVRKGMETTSLGG